MKKIGIGILVLFFVFAGAFSLNSNLDTLSISCSAGSVYFWVDNGASVNETLFLSATSNYLTAYFDDPIREVAPHSLQGSTLHIIAPDCFRGSEDVKIFAQLCSGESCEVKQKTVRVYVSPCGDCSSYEEHYATGPFYTPGSGCDSSNCAPVHSDIIRSASYSSTTPSITIRGAEGCTKIRKGNYARKKLMIINNGPTATLRVKMVNSRDISAYALSEYVNLVRGEAKDIYLDASASKHAYGRQYVLLEILSGNSVVKQINLCFDVEKEKGANMVLPKGVELYKCKKAEIIGKISNTGETDETFLLAGPSFASLPSTISLKPGEEKPIPIYLDLSSVDVGAHKLTITAQSSDLKGSATSSLVVKSCENKKAENKINKNVSQSKFKLTILVSNPGNHTLENVSISIIGLPSNWEVIKPVPTAIAPNESKNITAIVKPGSSTKEDGTLIVRAGDKTLFSRPVSFDATKISTGTGLFSEKNAPLIVVMVFVASLLLIYLYHESRAKSENISEGETTIIDAQEA